MAITNNFTEQITDLVTDLTSAEKLNFSEAIFTKSVETSPLTQDHAVVTGVRHGNLVPIIDNQPDFESFPFSDANTCAVPECDLGHNYSTSKWELGLIECKVPICLRSFDNDFLVFWNQYKMIQTDGEKNEEYIESALVQFLFNQFKTNHTAAQWRGGYFGDKSSASSLFNGIDGWFTQAEANSANVVDIAENAGTTFSAQKLSGERVYEILVAMYEEYSDMVWESDQPLEFRMSERNAKALANHYTFAKDRQNRADGLSVLDPEAVSNAPYPYQRLDFHGIPIRVMSVWDQVINKTTELNPGWVGKKLVTPDAARVNPNRILLTYKNNLVLGTSEQSNLAFFDIWHSKDDDKIYMKGGSYFGASIPNKSDYVLAI